MAAGVPPNGAPGGASNGASRGVLSESGPVADDGLGAPRPIPAAAATPADPPPAEPTLWVAEAPAEEALVTKRRSGPRHLAKGRSITAEQWITGALTVIGVGFAMIFVWLQLQPRLLLKDTLASGGDMGAHVWGPDYLRREILPHFSLSGWTKDWYAGFPAYKFYMVVPALLVIALDMVPFVPYTVAFKLVSVSGLVFMPLGAWFMGRMFRLPYPGPVLLAFGTLPFIFDFNERFRIIGGNAASTLAGEFSFSISLTVCLVYLGVVARGLETGRYRAWGAVLFALIMLNHLIPAMFAVVATLLLGLWRLSMDTRKPLNGLLVASFPLAVILAAWGGLSGALPVAAAVALPVLSVVLLGLGSWRLEPGWRATMLWVAPAGIIGAAVTGFWSLPFVSNHAYFNDMGWERIQKYSENLAPANSLTIVWYAVFALCVIGVVLSIVERQLIGGFLASSALVMGVLFATWPDTQMWNARFLPFYYLSLYLLAAVGLALFMNVMPNLGLRSVGAAIGALGLLFAAALPLGVVPGSKVVGGQWNFYGLFDAPQSFVRDWARWNYSGYQGKDKWPEYEAVVKTMSDIGRDRGCGRAMWEYQTDTLNSYGTPMSLMLLPMWTKGCIGSMEGLYFESSATTPFHFMNQSELSEAPSRAQRDLPYSALNVDLGVQHMQLMGVRYYMALTEAAKGQADQNAALSYITDSGPWSIYEVADSALVEPLGFEPAVLNDVGDAQSDWLEPSAEYYNDPARWTVPLASDGPDAWQRIPLGTQPEQRSVEPVNVSDIVEGTDTISFTVDQVGSPVLVKTSYFPNWKVEGGKGPYRVMPNLMVVVPTSTDVRMHFGRTGADWAGNALTLAGLAGVGWLALAGPLELHRPERRRRAKLTAADLDLSRYVLVFPDEPSPEGEPGVVPMAGGVASAPTQWAPVSFEDGEVHGASGGFFDSGGPTSPTAPGNGSGPAERSGPAPSNGADPPQ